MAANDASLDVPIDGDSASKWQSWLVDDSKDQEILLAEREEVARRSSQLLPSALKRLTTPERPITVERRLEERPTTIGNLSRHFRVFPSTSGRSSCGR